MKWYVVEGSLGHPRKLFYSRGVSTPRQCFCKRLWEIHHHRDSFLYNKHFIFLRKASGEPTSSRRPSRLRLNVSGNTAHRAALSCQKHRAASQSASSRHREPSSPRFAPGSRIALYVVSSPEWEWSSTVPESVIFLEFNYEENEDSHVSHKNKVS
jgi:hypothetical protein